MHIEIYNKHKFLNADLIDYISSEDLTPERSLYAAVIKRAVYDAYPAANGRRGNGNKDEQMDARRWLRSNSKAKHSFLAMCDILDLSPEHIRNELKRIYITGAKKILQKSENISCEA